MKYTVITRGDVPLSSTQIQTYYIDAKSEDEAKGLAETRFVSDYANPLGGLQIAVKKRTMFIPAIVFFVIAIFLSYIPWAESNSHNFISIAPDLITVCFSLGIYGAFVVRVKTLSRAFASKTDLIFYFLVVLLLSSLIQCVLGITPVTIPLLFWNINFTIDGKILMILALLFSWVGIKPLSIASFIAIAVFGISRIFMLNASMGNIWGPLYALCSFGALCLYLKNEDAVYEAVINQKSSILNRLEGFRTDLVESGIKSSAAIKNKSSKLKGHILKMDKETKIQSEKEHEHLVPEEKTDTPNGENKF